MGPLLRLLAFGPLALLSACGSDASPGAPATTDAASTGALDAGGPTTTEPPDVDGNAPGAASPVRCVKDPVAAVNGLSENGVLLGFNLNGYRDPTLFKHWEGVQRLTADGGRHLAVTRIAPEMFVVVEMGSRNEKGAAFGANRTSVGDAPPAADRIVAEVKEDDGFDHAGGMQALGDVLAVPLENGKISRVVFFDMSAPTKPVRIGQLERPTIGEAGTASLTALPDGRRLLVVGRKGDQILDVYSTKGDDLAFTLGATWGVSGDGVKTKLPDKDDNFGDYQNLNFVTGCDGTQYLLGTHREGTLVGSDYADLFTFAWAGGSAKPVITKVAKRHLSCSVSGKDQCNLDAAAGSYVTPDGALRLYAAEHDNDGPSGSIKMKEF